MAFNPLGTFHKNKKFWMAGILIICMISFVFCTGRGDLSERFSRGFHRDPEAADNVGGHRVTIKELGELKQQRALANLLMMNCADIAFKKLTSILMEEGKKVGKEKDVKRREELFRYERTRMSIAFRKDKPHYFDIGTKFDDLLEFKLWQAEADRLGIYIEDYHIKYMFEEEFFHVLSPEEIRFAERTVARNFNNPSDAFIRNAVGEEFRVRIAQMAVMGAQPFSVMARRPRENERQVPKFSNPEMPDEIRAPMTLAQLWDVYKSKRAEFDVTLIPVHVQDMVGQIKAPDEAARKEFFDKAKNKPFDPSSPDWGLGRPAQVKIEYVMADPESPAYSGTVKELFYDGASFDCTVNPMQSSFLTMANFVAASQAKMMVLEKQYEKISKVKNYRVAAPYSERDCLSPVLAWFAKGHAEAGASVVGRSLLSPTDPFGAVAGYLAWGASEEIKADTPADKDAKKVVERKFQPNPAIESSARAEMERRTPLYRALMLASSSGFPLDMAAPFLTMDPVAYEQFQGMLFGSYVPPFLTVETVAKEVQEVLVRQTAEEWAHENIRTIKKALEKSTGNEERFKRDLNKYVPALKLTPGPPDDKKGTYYNRYTIDKAPELAPLKKAFEKYVDMINFAEGRDAAPDTMLKPGDFYKMFFDPAESFCASTNYRAMPWPPKVKANSARAWKPADPRLIDRRNVADADFNAFGLHLSKQDPNRPPTEFDGLFENAEKPILFWRTGEIAPHRLGDLAKVEKELQTVEDELKQTAVKIKQEKDADKLEALHKAAADLKQTEIGLKETLQSVVDGWKYDQARETKALPKAKEIAGELVKSIDRANFIAIEGAVLTKLNRALVTLPNLSQMHPERFADRSQDYATPPLPKNTFDFPRDDMMKQILSLYSMKEPIKIDNKELDDINKELFNQVAKEKKPGNFVQILTNKPRSVYYVASITRQPHAELFLFAALSIRNAAYPQQGQSQDHFVQRAQQEFAKSYRKDIVAHLQKTLGYEGISKDARKSFDDQRGGD